MEPLKEPLVNYWYRALHSPFGIEITCSDPEGTRARLYAIRKEICDIDLADISICVSPFDSAKLWLVKKGSKDAKT